MKKTIILAIFALMLMSTPSNVKAKFNPFNPIDPFCLFSCKDDPKVINNTNSNNVNSNVNSPNSNVITTPINPVSSPIISPVIVNVPTPVYVYDNNNYNYNYNNDPLGVSCYPTSTYGETDETIIWRASAYGGNGNYNISWSGTNGLSGNGSSISKRYSSDGVKNASVVVTSGNQTVSRNCGSVEIRDYRNDYNDNRYDYSRDYRDYDYDDRYLTVSCSVNATFAPVGTRVTWSAYVSGGNGSYRYEWEGTDRLNGTGRDLEIFYNSPGTKTASVIVHSGSRRITQTCSNSVLVGVPTPTYINYYPTTLVYTAPVKSPVVKAPDIVKKEEVKEVKGSTLASLFSLENVPWGWVAILVILVLLFIIVYLTFNKNKI